REIMSAMVASSLNPEAPLFIPAALQQVEDFSPLWWDLVKSTAWFRDHWYHQHQQLDDMADSLIAFEAEDAIAVEASQPQPQPPTAVSSSRMCFCMCRRGAQGAEPGVPKPKGRRRPAWLLGEA
uniref:Ataxin-2 C-terminal domain-containing protein n=1 Tax=Aegilops tauschii subsp. strangulata TaxID=200361 RepID=A0A452Y4L8_AEGTS